MIELLYTTITVLGISVVPYILLASFQNMKIYFYLFQFIVWIILVATSNYKNHYLYNPTYESVHNPPYPPIKGIELVNDGSTLKELKPIYSTSKYSHVQTDIFSKECLENYFLPSDEDCPFTDIIVEYDGSKSYPDYQEITIGTGAVFYRNDFKKGRLYQNIILSPTDDAVNSITIDSTKMQITFSSSFDSEDATLVKRLEENKLSDPYKRFRGYIESFWDYIYLFLFIFSVTYFLMESRDDRKWNYFKIIDYIAQLIILFISLVRFSFFVRVKNFFNKNNDLYDDVDMKFDKVKYFDNYFPSDYSIQGFPLSISLSMLFFFIIFLIFPKKWSLQKKEFPEDKFYFFNDTKGESKIIYRIYILLFPFIVIYFVSFIFDCINDDHIRKVYKNTISNWAQNPITTISLSQQQDYEFGQMYLDKKKYSFYSWKNRYIKVTRNKKLNYMKIYSYKEEKGNKLCGKDSLGNKLYLPEKEDCPINGIYIGPQNTDYNSYNKIELAHDLFLYYTNRNLGGNILVDMKAEPTTVPIQLNYEKSNEICDYLKNVSFHKIGKSKCKKYYNFSTIPFYESISDWPFYDLIKNAFELNTNDNLGNANLFAITYLGLDSESIKSRSKVKHYKYYMDNFTRFSIFKDLLSCFNIIYFIYFSLMLLKNIADKRYLFYIAIGMIDLLSFHFIVVLSCLSINIQYVQKLMNEINEDFRVNRGNYGWLLVIFFLDLIFLFYYTTITLYMFMFKENSMFGWKWKDFELGYSKLNCFKKKNDPNKEDSNTDDNHEHKPKIHDIHNNQESKDKVIDKEKETEKPQHICIICGKSPTQVIFSPCGHKCVCDLCYQKEKEKKKMDKCPYCNDKIESVLMKVISI